MEFPAQASEREVAENSPAGTPVGNVITAIDNEGHPLTYTLKTPSSIFALDANTGQITVAQGASLDHEAQSTYTVVVEASDGVGVVGQGGNSIVSAEVTVTITVTDVNEAPPRPDAPSVTQSSSSPASALDVAWTEPDMTGKPAITDYDVRYRTQGETEWTDHAFTGTGTQTTLSGLAKDTAYEVQVLARNDEGDSPWSDSGSDSTTPSVSIHSPGDPVGEGSSVDLPVSLSSPVDAIVTVSWSTGGGSGSGSERANAADGPPRASHHSPTHEHEPSSGTVVFQPGQTQTTITINILDDEEHEDPESFSIVLTEVTVSSPDDEVSMGRRTATVTIADDDAAPQFTESGPASRSVKENTPPGRAIGAPITANDAEDDPLTYTLSGADAGAFTIDGATGQLRTKAPLDFETRRTYDALTVTVDDGHGHTDTRSLTVSVTDVDEPPTKPDAPTVLQTVSNPSSTLGVTWTAPDMRGKPAITDYDVRYRVAGAAEWTDNAFTGTGTQTTLTGLTAETSYEVQVLAKNHEGNSPWSDSGVGSTVAADPTPEPTPEPTPVPTPEPTPVTTPEQTPVTTPEQTPVTTPEPTTPVPTPEQTPVPTPEPTPVPTPEPTPVPTPEPTPVPTPEPTLETTPVPTPEPTQGPSRESTPVPTPEPMQEPAPETTPESGTEPSSEPEPASEPTSESEPALKPAPVPTPEPTPGPTSEPEPEAASATSTPGMGGHEGTVRDQQGYGYGGNGYGNGGGINTPPIIIGPDDKSYSQGQTINPFGILVVDDDPSPTVTLEGLPDNLFYDPERSMTRGTVADDAEVGDYAVTITADDGEYRVTETFTVTVRLRALSAPAPVQSSGGETVATPTPTPVSGQPTGGEETVATPTPVPDQSTDDDSGIGIVGAATPSPTPSPTPAPGSGTALTIGLPSAPGADLIALPKFMGSMSIDDKALAPAGVIALFLLLLLLIAAWKRRKKKSTEQSPRMRESNVLLVRP